MSGLVLTVVGWFKETPCLCLTFLSCEPRSVYAAIFKRYLWQGSRLDIRRHAPSDFCYVVFRKIHADLGSPPLSNSITSGKVYSSMAHGGAIELS
jgi:hypothetical protein